MTIKEDEQRSSRLCVTSRRPQPEMHWIQTQLVGYAGVTKPPYAKGALVEKSSSDDGASTTSAKAQKEESDKEAARVTTTRSGPRWVPARVKQPRRSGCYKAGGGRGGSCK
ncbi:hypothetical protein PInf_024712 [Phytophthora infestans]|nr:hypothetical protein PInf_024712 [Phytophthora infestans]